MIQEAPPLFKQDMCPQCWKAVLSSPEFQIFSKTFFGPDHEEKVLFPVAMVNHCSWVVYLWFVYFCICFLKLCFCFPKLFPDHKEKVLFPVVMVNHCSWVVYLWSGLSQIESAILSHAVTVDIKLRAQAKETVQNQASAESSPFKSLGERGSQNLGEVALSLVKRRPQSFSDIKQSNRKREKEKDAAGMDWTKQSLECCSQHGACWNQDGI